MIKIGIIGYGHRGKLLGGLIEKLDSNAAITAIADSRHEGIRQQLGEDASRIAFYETAEELFDQERLDGVIVGTRRSSHSRIRFRC